MITYYQANKVLNFNFRNESYTPPTSYFVGLSTTEIFPDGTGITEPSDVAYSRMEYVNNTGTLAWTTDNKTYVKNAIEIPFPTASAEWGTIKYVFLADESDNILYYHPLKWNYYIKSGDTATFSINSFIISVLR